MTNNNMLLAVVLMERVMPLLKEEKREQISRAGVSSISHSILQVYERFCSVDTKSGTLVMKINAVVTILTSLLDEPTFYETDEETKELLLKECNDIMSSIYLMAGKYYMSEEFDYNPRLSSTLNRIIDKCILMGFYFGVDKELEREGA